MTWLPDQIVNHLRDVLESPDLSGLRYELLEEIGRGGMGVVYLARDPALERNVALKVLNVLDPAGPAVARLTREAQILAHLEHPGIVPVHDTGMLPDGRAYYTMKFVQGVRLDRHAAAGPSLADLLRLFTRVCEPVAFAHAHGVIHRDLKPENVMVGPFGEVLVLDWGVAQSFPNEPGSGAITGTPGYMSPEQEAGGPVDGRSDIYSLGRMLACLVQDRSAVPKQIHAIVRKATHADPALRYPGAMDLAAEIGGFLDGEAVSAYRESLLERAARWLSRNKTLVALVATYLLARAVIFLLTRR